MSEEVQTMNHLKETTQKVNGLTLHTVQTRKFKTLTYYFQFRSTIDRETVTQRALLSGLLKSATKHLPTIKKLNQRLDDLYGATLSSHVQKKGNDHILSIFIHGVNEKYLSNSGSISADTLALLAEAILDPLAENGAFDEGLVNQEKRTLKSRIEALYDDKMRFASQRLIDEMCEGEPFAIHTNGYIEDLDQITPSILYQTYQDMLKNDEMDLYIVGDSNPDSLLNAVQQQFVFDRTTPIYVDFEAERKRASEFKIIKESQDVEQGKLNLGYRSNIVFGDPDYYASQVFNGLFGGFPHSKLFMNVREKASLAYYATSRTESFKGLLIVMSGIEFENYDQATTIIEEQLKKMLAGDFTDLEMKQTKALLINSVLEGLDNPFSVIDLHYNHVLVKDSPPLDAYFSEIEKVTKEDVIKVAEKIQPDTIYFLTGKEEA